MHAVHLYHALWRAASVGFLPLTFHVRLPPCRSWWVRTPAALKTQRETSLSSSPRRRQVAASGSPTAAASPRLLCRPAPPKAPRGGPPTNEPPCQRTLCLANKVRTEAMAICKLHNHTWHAHCCTWLHLFAAPPHTSARRKPLASASSATEHTLLRLYTDALSAVHVLALHTPRLHTLAAGL